jgi:hypothetical protein
MLLVRGGKGTRPFHAERRKYKHTNLLDWSVPGGIRYERIRCKSIKQRKVRCKARHVASTRVIQDVSST